MRGAEWWDLQVRIVICVSLQFPGWRRSGRGVRRPHAALVVQRGNAVGVQLGCAFPRHRLEAVHLLRISRMSVDTSRSGNIVGKVVSRHRAERLHGVGAVMRHTLNEGAVDVVRERRQRVHRLGRVRGEVLQALWTPSNHEGPVPRHDALHRHRRIGRAAMLGVRSTVVGRVFLARQAVPMIARLVAFDEHIEVRIRLRCRQTTWPSLVLVGLGVGSCAFDSSFGPFGYRAEELPFDGARTTLFAVATALLIRCWSVRTLFQTHFLVWRLTFSFAIRAPVLVVRFVAALALDMG